MRDVFSDLPDFLKEYVHESGWRSFRSIQESAFGIIIAGSSDVILSSGTSSGKTEAALFPVMASLYTDPSDGIGALYISPLKALINDQYGRISRILKRSGIDVTGWHGDIGGHVKERMKTEPKEILQMTPESLQALIGGDPDSVRRMFPGLRFVIIDEMHAFMDSDRGLQLLCCLDRVESISGCTPRRIGLSATISDIPTAEDWIRAGRDTGTSTIEGDDDSKRNIAISYHFLPRTDSVEGPQARKDAVAQYYKALLRVTDRNRCLVFANSRDTAERTERSMRKMIDGLGLNREVHLHHGRLSQETRRRTEEALNSSARNITVVSTSTLEMGIDIGDMDRIVQIDAPHSCSSLLQRMGRSGRRENRQNLAVMCREDDDRRVLPQILRMNLVKALAEVQLSVDDGWSEPPQITRMPYGLLFHQTLEYIRETIGVGWNDLKKDVLGQYPFRHIPSEDYRDLLKHMHHQRILSLMDDGTILLGPEGERIAFGKDFHTVFRSVTETEIRHQGERIGAVEGIPEVGDIVRVSDGLWIVRMVDAGGRFAEAEPANEGSFTTGRGMIPEIHGKVTERMREILLGQDEDARMTSSAKEALDEARRMYRRFAKNTFTVSENRIRIHVWSGSKVFRTLNTMFSVMKGVKVVRSYEPYIIDVMTEMDPSELIGSCDRLAKVDPSEIILGLGMNLRYGKYDRFIPDRLLAKAYVTDRLEWREKLLQD